jgi:uncharacterized membrane protein YeaQ/YmgE (transglycosylase-associated protein family)
VISFLFLLIVASILGSIGAALAGRRGDGCLISVAIGFIGALLGRGMSNLFEVRDPLTITIRDTTFPLMWTIAGSALFVAVITFLTRGKDPTRR